MRYIRFISSNRSFMISLATIVLIFLLDLSAHAADDDYRLTRLEWRILRDEVVVTYDLEGEANEDYVVGVSLLRESDKAFRMNPIFVTGKVGKGKFSGTDNEIRWAYKNENSGQLDGDDYYIELRVDKPSGFPWLIAAGGAAIAGIAVVLASNKKSSPQTDAVEFLPYPPPRP